MDDTGLPHPAAAAPPSLAEVRDRIAGVGGWLTDDQVAVLHREAAAVAPDATVVEIGSFQGRSTIVLASAVPHGVVVVAIDPHAGNDRGPQEFDGYEAEAQGDHETFLANLRRAGVDEKVRHVRKPSDQAHDDVAGAIDLLFIDGAHRFVPARRDLADWGDRVRPGGTMLVHDAFSSVGVTAALAATVAADPRWRYDGRTGSLACYRRQPVHGVDRVASVVDQARELRWFARNVAVKATILLERPDLARRLGHDGETWPH